MKNIPNTPVKTDTEHKLLKLCAMILLKEQETIRKSDDFFSLGGDSILAMKLVSKISQEFGITLPLKTVFLSNSLQELSNNIATLMAL